MTDILYTYGDEVYANITNYCDCSCTFCIRANDKRVGDATNLWFRENPTLEEVLAAMDGFDFSPYRELVFCGYGEPTCALDILVESARYAKEKLGLQTRLNTNGLGNLFNGRDAARELVPVIDTFSISLNGPTEEVYNRVTRPALEGAFEAMLSFARECKELGAQVKFTVVDVITPQEIEDCRRLAEEMGIPLRVRGYISEN